MDKTQLLQARNKKLSESGLDAKDAKRLGYDVFTTEEVERKFPRLGPLKLGGFVIPYWDFRGRRTKFFRFRYLEKPNGFAGLTKLANQRYGQDAGALNEIFLSPFVDNWEEIRQDPTQDLLIVEGENKANCANKTGDLPATIALGGVFMFKSKRHGKRLLDQLKAIVWSGRRVFICFDSDIATNPDVAQAANALARLLLDLGAQVDICHIPALEPGKKTGIDDYIVGKGAPSFKGEILDKATEWAPSRELFKLNEEVLYVRDPGLILRVDEGKRIAFNVFVQHAYAPRTFEVTEFRGKDKIPVQVVKRTAAEWIKWPHRAEVEQIVYRPGAPRLTSDGNWNIWKGWAVEPKAGTVQPWKNLLESLFWGSPDEHRRWFEQWLAYPLQHPGVKLYSAVLLWSRQTGTGKTTVGYSLGRIYGPNFAEIGDRDLFATHNEWAENRQLVLGDEITGDGRDKKANADRLKGLITQQKIWLNPKYIPTYSIDNCVNYLFTSNHADAFYVDPEDRRLFIHEVQTKLPAPALDRWFRDEYYPWLNNGGASALFHHLLNLSLEGFAAEMRAPLTAAKRDMQEASMGALRLWLTEVRTKPDEVLAPIMAKWQVWTAQELADQFYRTTNGRVGADKVGRALRDLGCRKVPYNTPRNDKVRGLLDVKGSSISTSLWWVRPGDPPPNLSTLKGVREQFEKERPMRRVAAETAKLTADIALMNAERVKLHRQRELSEVTKEVEAFVGGGNNNKRRRTSRTP